MERIHLGNVCVHSRMWRLCMNETIQERDVYDDYLYLSLKFPHHHCVHMASGLYVVFYR